MKNIGVIKTRVFSHLMKTKNILSADSIKYLKKDTIVVNYKDFNKNWGDYVNPYFISALTGKNVISAKRNYNYLNRRELLAIGSIMNRNLTNLVVWGSGFIEQTNKNLGNPHRILAVRGKLSAQILKERNIDFDPIYGDPVLLLPEIYSPKRNKRFTLGIIPHYTELEILAKEQYIVNNDEILIISPWVQKGDWHKFINQINSCENIISSSLHGLIVADVYNIPTLRFTYGGGIIGGDFKFDDYYSGVGISSHDVVSLNSVKSFDLRKIVAQCSIKELCFDPALLKNALLDYYSK